MKGRGSIERWLEKHNGRKRIKNILADTQREGDGMLVDFNTSTQLSKKAGNGFEVNEREPNRMHDPSEERRIQFVNPIQQGTRMYNALENFTKSCAGYAVATFVLGIGDRHNDNIMLTKDGKFFHIDFGHFLGNFKMKFGYKRERAPFVFTQHMAQVLGGRRTGERYRKFEDSCGQAFNILRRHSNIFLVLFNLMIGCQIPELESSQDLLWIVNAMKVEQSDEEAAERFEKLIHESLKCQTTRVMHLIHSLKHAK